MQDDQELPFDMTSIRRFSETTPLDRAIIDQNVAMTRDMVVEIIGLARWHRQNAPHECEPWCIGGRAIAMIRDLEPHQLRQVCNFLVHLQAGGT